MNKKGSILDIPYIVIGIFTLAFVAILVSIAVYKINAQFQLLPDSIIPTDAKTAAGNMSVSFPTTVNYGLVFLFFGLAIVAIVLAAFIPSHPIFMIFYMLEILLMIIVGGALSDAYEQLSLQPALADVMGYFTLLTFLFRYLPFIIFGLGVILAAVMYKVTSADASY